MDTSPSLQPASSDSAETTLLHSILERKKAELSTIFAMSAGADTIHTDDIRYVLMDVGLDPEREDIKYIMQQMYRQTSVSVASQQQEVQADRIDIRLFTHEYNHTASPVVSRHEASVLDGYPAHDGVSVDVTQAQEQREVVHNIVQRALQGTLAIPQWRDFCNELVSIFEEVRPLTYGKNASYIPYLAEVDSELFGMSICTVDGQVFSYGDCDYEFTMYSTSKAFTYCIAAEDFGVTNIHKYIGFEPSGVAFNAFTLDSHNVPHNPMINAGAIATCSLIKPHDSASKRFMYLNERFAYFAGGNKFGFDNATYLSEKQTADRNFALAYYMSEHKVFPPETNLEEMLDLYFYACSILGNCKRLAVMASTLANAGTCPLTHKKVASPETVKCALYLMYSCGMYDYSGEWSCVVGLPSKSGVSGAIVVVIPGVAGLCIFSPRLDRRGNSVRGVEFCKKASNKFNWSLFSMLVSSDPDEEESAVKAQHRELEQQKLARTRSASPIGEISSPRETLLAIEERIRPTLEYKYHFDAEYHLQTGSSRPGTPVRLMSPEHLIQHKRKRSESIGKLDAEVAKLADGYSQEEKLDEQTSKRVKFELPAVVHHDTPASSAAHIADASVDTEMAVETPASSIAAIFANSNGNSGKSSASATSGSG